MNPIAHLRALARDLRISVPDLIRRRFARESRNHVAVIEGGVIRIKPRMYVSPYLTGVKVWNGRGVESFN